MANAEDSLSSLALAAFEVKTLTGWGDEMVEDYLTIIRNLSDLAEVIDTNAVEIIERLDNAEQVAPSLKRLNSKLLGLTSRLSDNLESQKNKTDETIATLSRASNKNRSLANKSFYELKNYVPQKGLLLAITGVNTASPTIVDSYNTTSIVRNALGIYRVTMSQATIFNKNVFLESCHSVTFNIAPSATTEVFNAKLNHISSGVFDIEVYEVTQKIGVGLELTPYDLQITDRLSVSMDLSIGSYLPQE